MRIKIILTVLVAISSSRVSFAADFGVYSEFFGRSYLSQVTQEQLDKTPAWSADNEQPPLSARKAIKASKEILDNVYDPQEHPRWKVDIEEIAIKPLGNDYWVWIVRFEAKPKTGGATGVASYLDVVVLMDGSAVRLQEREPDDNKSAVEDPQR